MLKPGCTEKHTSDIEEGLGNCVTNLHMNALSISHLRSSICWNVVIGGYPGTTRMKRELIKQTL